MNDPNVTMVVTYAVRTCKSLTFVYAKDEGAKEVSAHPYVVGKSRKGDLIVICRVDEAWKTYYLGKMTNVVLGDTFELFDGWNNADPKSMTSIIAKVRNA